MKIGLIGAGNIGSTLARLAVDQGHDVVLSNSRGPQTLTDLVSELGEHASAATAAHAADGADLVVVTMPLKNYLDVPAQSLAGMIVIDTNNYYPDRDGHIAALDDGSTTSSELLAAHLPTSAVVKAFNSIYFKDLASQGQPAGTPDRRALPIAGDDAEAKGVVSALIEEFGFDVVDVGSLSDSRPFQPDTPAYVTRYDADALRSALAAGPH